MKNRPGEMTSKSQEIPENGFLNILRIVTLIVLAVGMVGSLFFMFREGQNTPRFLLVLFFFWVMAPFAVLFQAHFISKRWTIPTRLTLYIIAILVSLGSLAVYSRLIDVKPSGSANAFLYVIVPPASLVLSVMTVGIARILSGRPSHP